MLEDLRDTMARLGIRYRKELRASPEVVAALTEISTLRPVDPVPVSQPDMRWMTEIEVHGIPGMDAGAWVLVLHSDCEVIYEKDAEPRVSHAGCKVAAFGTIKGEDHGHEDHDQL